MLDKPLFFLESVFHTWRFSNLYTEGQEILRGLNMFTEGKDSSEDPECWKHYSEVGPQSQADPLILGFSVVGKYTIENLWQVPMKESQHSPLGSGTSRWHLPQNYIHILKTGSPPKAASQRRTTWKSRPSFWASHRLASISSCFLPCPSLP